MNELRNRGVGDILIAVVDGLKGFPEAINAVFPQTIIQTCVVHLIRRSLEFVSWKDRKPVVPALRMIYRAKDATADKAVRDQLASFEQMGFGKAPVCVAKTQYSFSTNADAKGAPTDHTINVREVRLSAGAEFVVAICGEIMTMPGLPRVPAADSIDIGADGRIVGLF